MQCMLDWGYVLSNCGISLLLCVFGFLSAAIRFSVIKALCPEFGGGLWLGKLLCYHLKI